ncbi:hypothetical protein QF026_001225 [Streptomyces aurantiacus]|uniref:hypothetical protein n=1 Tax=Streptomyces aurantiacus TaxID=47760 RepID=UPI0027925D19|nr:hypothetical protein [Streptomyces aurantiacus]MDQ0772759.1 hypothetical protein [Streptomyces aurantiacus]
MPLIGTFTRRLAKMPLLDLNTSTAGLSKTWAGFLRDWDRSLRAGNFDEDEIDRSPMERVRQPKLPEKLIPVVRADETLIVLGTCKGKHRTTQRPVSDRGILFTETADRLPDLPGPERDPPVNVLVNPRHLSPAIQDPRQSRAWRLGS